MIGFICELSLSLSLTISLYVRCTLKEMTTTFSTVYIYIYSFRAIDYIVVCKFRVLHKRIGGSIMLAQRQSVRCLISLYEEYNLRYG